MRRRRSRPRAYPAGTSADSHAPAPGGHQPAIVVGHDGRPGDERVLAVALSLAERLSAHVHVMHSVTLEDYGTDPDTESFEAVRDRRTSAQRDYLHTAMAMSQVAWTYHEAHGAPARRLAQLADDVDAEFIVVGAGHHGFVRHVLSGGQAWKHLLAEQERPVLVVPTADRGIKAAERNAEGY